jgi:outer membrane protein OmpA-like peptidoglycan-associated protein
MNKRIIGFILLLIFIFPPLHAATNHLFLEIPPFARAIGMAEAFTAVSDGSYALYYNPAGMSSVLGFETQLSWVHWFQDINYGYLAIINPDPVLSWGKIGLAFSWFSADRPYGKTDNYPINWDSYDYKLKNISNYTVTLGGAFDVIEQLLSVGVTLKLTSEDMSDGTKGANSGMNIGILARFLMWGHYLRMGLTASSSGTDLVSNTNGLEPPGNISLGISDEFDAGDNKLLISADTCFSGTNPLFKLGAEYSVFPFLTLRAGYKIGAYFHPTLGAGFKYNNLELNYAYEDYEVYGPTHTVSLLFSWWTPPIGLKVAPQVFSPNGDNRFDKVEITPEVRDMDKVTSLNLRIMDADGKTALVILPIANKYTRKIEWDGRINSSTAQDGVYKLELDAEYIVNGGSRSKQVPVEIDTTPPRVLVDASPKFLKPGKRDALLIPSVFTMSADDRNGIESWELHITDYEKKEFFTLKGKGVPPMTYVWDGKGNKGEYVETGRIYYYSMKASDMLGNVFETVPVPQVILLKEIKLTFSSDALFDLGETSVKSTAYHSLKKMKQIIDGHPDSEIIVSGHTDSAEPFGKYASRQELSEARAKAIKFYMQNLLGITKRVINIEGHGDSLPLEDNNTEAGRAKNRRVEVMIRSTIYK